MSDNTTTKTTATGIVAKVLAWLNITEEGKIVNFFERLRNDLIKEIKKLKRNLEVTKDEYNDKLEVLQEQKQDAEARVDEAYMNVTVENINTNEKASSFVNDYWNNIERAESALDDINSRIKETEEYKEDTIKSIQEQIAERERRLNKIK